ncbi:MAG: DNA polymerase IV [Candidatus Roizmanbacteria bacterium]|nr:DNA polymerase IV [Candidatus Roizmanbacteria bacterium]
MPVCIHSWPQAIIHVDGNAFFASVMQAAYPHYANKPLVVGKERGIATAISYEARAYGITRGMQMHEIRLLCPHCILVEGDYELFSLFSQRMFTILRTYSPTVEEYSVDEGFADITGLRRPFHASYEEIGKKIQNDIQHSLGIPISIGISITKSLAKLASESKKPRGCTVVPGKHIESFLASVPIAHVWGIGPSTAALLTKLGIHTARDFILMPSAELFPYLSKPFKDLWHELRGTVMHAIDTNTKNTYQSISRTRTFAHPTKDRNYLWAQLRENIEACFAKARRFGYSVADVHLFLKTQQFRYIATSLRFSTPQRYPLTQLDQFEKTFLAMYQQKTLYRATGCTVGKLSQGELVQSSLFETPHKRAPAIYRTMENRHDITFGTSLWLASEDRKTTKHMRIPMLTVRV